MTITWAIVKRYALAIIAALGALAIAVAAALGRMRANKERRRVTDIATSLAEENARRARDQAIAAQTAVDAQAAAAITEVDGRALKESTDAASTGDLSRYLNSRSSER